jgi:hypothetical protein
MRMPAKNEVLKAMSACEEMMPILRVRAARCCVEADSRVSDAH